MNKIYLGGTEVANVGSGGGGDMTNYYDKSHIDASFNYVDEAIEDIGDDLDHLNSSKVESSSVYLKEHIDASYGVIDSSLKSFDSSIKTFKPIVYTNTSTYSQMAQNNTLDENTTYFITDMANTDDLENIITIDDLSTYKSNIKNDLSTFISQDLSTAKSNALSAVSSQQTTSVNAVSYAQSTAVSQVNSAKTTALSDISTLSAQKIASMPTFVVCNLETYQGLTPNSSTIYFITEEE